MSAASRSATENRDSGATMETNPLPATGEKERTASTHKQIEAVLVMLQRLEEDRNNIDDTEKLVKNLNNDGVLRAHLDRLKTRHNILKWRAKPSRLKIKLDPVVVEKLLDIQKDSASAVGALAVVGATLAISLMYSATRGNMWYPYIAWWLFVGSLALASGLSFASAGSTISGASDRFDVEMNARETANLERRTPPNWVRKKLSVVAVAFCLFGVAGGWAMLSAGAAGYNLHGEVSEHNPAAIVDGPDLGTKGISLASRLVAYILIGIFVVILIGGYFYRLRPRLQRSASGDHKV